MIAVDTNLLLYAHRAESPLHEKAIERLDWLAASGRPWGTVWQCVHEFISIATNAKIFRPASSLEECFAEVENWRACPTFRLIAEGHVHWGALQRVLREGRVSGGLVHDARIAAVCLAHGVEELWSADRDFSRFPRLRVVNPLVG